MRKLAKGLYHVGRGRSFDSSKLFDTRGLQVGDVAKSFVCKGPKPSPSMLNAQISEG
jgi:hypothetical protein